MRLKVSALAQPAKVVVSHDPHQHLIFSQVKLGTHLPQSPDIVSMVLTVKPVNVFTLLPGQSEKLKH